MEGGKWRLRGSSPPGSRPVDPSFNPSQQHSDERGKEGRRGLQDCCWRHRRTVPSMLPTRWGSLGPRRAFNPTQQHCGKEKRAVPVPPVRSASGRGIFSGGRPGGRPPDQLETEEAVKDSWLVGEEEALPPSPFIGRAVKRADRDSPRGHGNIHRSDGYLPTRCPHPTVALISTTGDHVEQRSALYPTCLYQ